VCTRKSIDVKTPVAWERSLSPLRRNVTKDRGVEENDVGCMHRKRVSEHAIMAYQIQEIRIRDYTQQKKRENYCSRQKRSSNAMYAMQCQAITPVVVVEEVEETGSSVDGTALSPSIVEDLVESTVIGSWSFVDSCTSASVDRASGSAVGVGSRGPV
jgi:hypothetical protein